MLNKVSASTFRKLLKNPPQLPKLKVGDTVYGRIYGFSDKDHVVGVFNGVPLIARTDLPLKIGQRIFARVADIKNGQYILKILDERTLKEEKKQNVELFLKKYGLQLDEKSEQVLRKIISYRLPINSHLLSTAREIINNSSFALSVFLRLASLYPRQWEKYKDKLKKFSPRLKLKLNSSRLQTLSLNDLKKMIKDDSFPKLKSNSWDNLPAELQEELFLWEKAYQKEVLPFRLKEDKKGNPFILKRKISNGVYTLEIEGQLWEEAFDCKLLYFREMEEKKLYLQFFDLPLSLQSDFQDHLSVLLENLGFSSYEFNFFENTTSWQEEEPALPLELPLLGGIDLKV